MDFKLLSRSHTPGRVSAKRSAEQTFSRPAGSSASRAPNGLGTIRMVDGKAVCDGAAAAETPAQRV